MIRMKRPHSLAMAAIACLSLTACGSDAEVTAENTDASGAEGEILGGEISDDMLPLDDIRSKSPRADGKENGGGEGDGEGGDAGEEGSEDTSEAE